MERLELVRWIFDKLLGAFLISAAITWGPLVGFDPARSSLQVLYPLIVAITVASTLLSYLLVKPPSWLRGDGEEVLE